MNLMVITMDFKKLTAWGILIMYCVLVVFTFFLFKGQIYSIQGTLFLSQVSGTKCNELEGNMINIALISGVITYICYIILKIVFLHNEIVGLIGIDAMWFFINVGFIAVEICIEFPYQVQGYYKRKYAEEYRKWYDKSQIEWYGEKYFNKHILGTSKEDKTGNYDLANVQITDYEKVHKAVLSDQKKENGDKNDE